MKILLIHGLSRTPLSLVGLESYLQQKGAKTEQFAYLAFAETFDSIVERLYVHCQAIAQSEPYGIVAHSLGGLLIRAVLAQGSIALPEHIVMLGTPNQLPRLAPIAWKLLPFRWWTGHCGFNLTNPAFFKSLPSLTSPYTIIAGTLGPTGVWSPFGNELNDGIVAVSETLLSELDDVIQLPVWHTFMMNDPTVQQTVAQALCLGEAEVKV
ncbi:MAG: alpha/beta hydrolase [Crocosphaera sp.]|nr:alpha/beta hydrolase [Crocosphaera sp.]